MPHTLVCRSGLLLGAIVLAVPLAACGAAGSGAGTAARPAPTSVSHSAPTSGMPGAGTSASKSSPPTVPAVAVITIKDFAYELPPSVKPGETIEVKNADQVAHTVTADSSSSLFNVTVYPGKTATFTAPTTPGTYKLHCTFHANMHGALVVA